LARLAASAVSLAYLQGRVGLLVGGDFLQQQRVLARRFFFGHDAAVVGQHVEPADDAGDDGEDEEDDRIVRLTTSPVAGEAEET
jgi:hypothetical protein